MTVMFSPTPSAITETGIVRLEPRAGAVERDARARHVGDDEVQRRPPARQQLERRPRGAGGDRRRDEARDVGAAGRPAAARWRSLAVAERLVRALQPLGAGRPRRSGPARP